MLITGKRGRAAFKRSMVFILLAAGVMACKSPVFLTGFKVKGVSLDPDSVTIPLGGEQRLTAVVTPETASIQTVSWSSDSPGVKVSDTGLVTAIAPGTATVKVTTMDGGFTATCSISISPITLDKSALTLAAGKSEFLTATIHPAYAQIEPLTWSSSNNAVAYATDGHVGALAQGTAVITATTADGAFSASCAVTVTGSLPHTYFEVLPAANAIQNGINAAAASNNPADPAYSTFTPSPRAVACHFNGYANSGYVLAGSIVVSLLPDDGQGPMNGTVDMTGGTVTRISYENAVFTVPKSGSLHIRFTDLSSWTLNLSTGTLTQN